MSNFDPNDFFDDEFEEKKPKRRMSTGMILAFLLVITGLVLVVFFFVYKNSDTFSSQPEPVETEVPEQKVEKAEPAKAAEETNLVPVTPAPNVVPAGAAGSDNLKIGQTVDFGGIQYTLNSATLWPGDATSVPGADKVFIALNFTVRNNTQSNYTTLGASFSFYADGWSEQEVSTNYGKKLSGETITPGTQESGDRVYEIPNDWSQLKLRIKPNAVIEQTGTYIIEPSEVN